MDQTPGQADRGLWGFWIACAVAAIGAVTPYVLSGGSDRVNGALIPFALAAVAFAACALLHHQGRPIATALYFVASLAVVFGLLSLLALPLRLAMLGTCPGPERCALGLERPITSSETSALGFAIAMGIVSILAAFFALRTQYHRHRIRKRAANPPTPPPPARRIPPVGAKSEGQTTPETKPSEVGAAVTDSHAQPEPQHELPAHEPDLELPAHTTATAPDGGGAVPAPAPSHQPRQQSKPRIPPTSSS